MTKLFYQSITLGIITIAFSSLSIAQQNRLESEIDPLIVQKSPEHNQTPTTEQSEHNKMVILARKSPLAGLSPTTQSTFLIQPENQPNLANTLTELVEGSPGVAENSQPGLFQVVSIRGVSRQRILTMLDGVRLSSERRAGVAASFIDPSIIQSIAVTRGPASTYYGSGAMGGLMQLGLKKIIGNEFSTGFDTSGHENYQNYSWGSEGEQSENHLSLVRRKANNSEDVNGNALNTHFEQYSALFQNSTAINNLDRLSFLNQSQVDSWAFASKGTDLGRSNSRFPDRIVNIPQESHHLFKSSITSSHQWAADFYIHDQSITTQTIRPNESANNVKNSSLDSGFNWQMGWQNKSKAEQHRSSSLFGIDVFSRKNVNSEETTINLSNDDLGNNDLDNNDLDNNDLSFNQTLSDASKTELATFYSFHFQLNNYRLQSGGRYTSERSNNKYSRSISNKAFTGFAGIAYDVSDQIELNANIGNAFRFPSLTELYFSGTTARGEITGNENLVPEESINYEIGFKWSHQSSLLKMTVFENKFDQYIERVTTGTNNNGDDILTFINQQNGKIKGIETEYQLDLSAALELSLIATSIQGENDFGETLADIPSDRASLTFNYHKNNWQAQIKLQHRRTKSKFGNGELATPAVNLLTASYQHQLNANWLVKIVCENLFDAEYVGSADDLATLMPGRSFGFSVVWRD